MAEIFNKEALEALDDHSEAKEMARVASPRIGQQVQATPANLERENWGYADGHAM